MNILHIIFSFNNGGSENLVVDLLNSWNNEKDNEKANDKKTDSNQSK